MAERYRDELATALPEADLVAPFGTSLTGAPGAPGPAPGAASGAATTARVELVRRPPRDGAGIPDFDLLNLPRPAASAPWAYVKVAEGCDRRCGFCAIPSFRGAQRSRRSNPSSPKSTTSEPTPPSLVCARWSSSPRISPPTASTDRRESRGIPQPQGAVLGVRSSTW